MFLLSNQENLKKDKNNYKNNINNLLKICFNKNNKMIKIMEIIESINIKVNNNNISQLKENNKLIILY